MARKSFLDCKHQNVQQFTDYCLDCGYNIWTTREEYLADLKRQCPENDPEIRAIRRLEKALGIGE